MSANPSPVLDPGVRDLLRPDANGLVAAVVQEHGTGEVLMLAWMDEEALRRTLATGRATYWSRSRRRYWVKGETSGHHQHVRSVSVDCDGDALLVRVEQIGPACHTGSRSCFNTPIGPGGPEGGERAGPAAGTGEAVRAGSERAGPAAGTGEAVRAGSEPAGPAARSEEVR